MIVNEDWYSKWIKLIDVKKLFNENELTMKHSILGLLKDPTFNKGIVYLSNTQKKFEEHQK